MKLIREDIVSDIRLRVESVRRNMQQMQMDAVLIASNANIFYTTGRFFRGYVYIPAENMPVWFVVRPKGFETGDDIIEIRKPELIPDELKKLGISMPGKIGFEYDDMTYSDIKRLEAIFPDSQSVNASPVVRKARMVKTPWEIDQMRFDGIHQAEVYRRIRHCYKEDMTDIEFQIEIEKTLRLEGCLGYIRTSGNLMEINMGSVIAGDNADAPGPYEFTMGGSGADPSLPVGANGTTIHRGETVMVDVCGAFNGYQTDMTRVWRLGEIPKLAYKAHECSRNIMRECEKIGLPGAKVSDLYEKALKIAEDEGLREYFMGHNQQAPFIGHGVGIQLNELPVVTSRSRDILEGNMTIALEPKFVIPHVGAVGIENTYVVTASGLECITVFPEEIQEL